MKKSDTFSDRRQDADAAKARRLDKFKASPGQASPKAVERAAARKAQSAAQAESNAAAELRKVDKADRLRSEAAAKEVAAKEAAANEALRQAEKLSAEQTKLAEDKQRQGSAKVTEAPKPLDEAALKARRDARYASRKARR